MTSIANKNNNVTPQEVRSALGIDNRKIVDLCRHANIVPKKNLNGQIYFSKDEFETLRKASKNLKSTALAASEQKAVVNNLMIKLDCLEQNLTDVIAKTLDEKLDGMDEVVVELIRCKTENENLKQKINELNKENYHLKNSLNMYKPLPFGLYLKKEDDFII